MSTKTVCFVSLLLFGCAIQVDEVEEKTEPQQKFFYSNNSSPSQETTCQTTVYLITDDGQQVVLHLKCANPGTKDVKSDNWGTQDSIDVSGFSGYVRPPSPGDPR